MNELSPAIAIKNLILSMLSDVHTAMPGRIEKYDYATQKADVKPLLKREYPDGTSTEFPVIPCVPVVMPRTAKSAFIFPINKGDTVLVIFSERSLDNWLSSSGGVVEPGLSHQFDLTDAIAIPGLFAFNQSSPAENNSDLLIKHEDQTITIKANGDIELGANSIQKLLNKAAMDKYNSHTHAITGYMAGTMAGISAAPLAYLMVENVHTTTKVKAQ